MQTYAVYLKPKSSFVTWPTSDTLFGALCWAVYQLYDKQTLETMLDNFNKEPKFVLSSAFPYLERNEIYINFFPKPLLRELTSSEAEELALSKIRESNNTKSLEFKRNVLLVSETLKEFRKVSYISESLFKGIIEESLDLKKIYQRLKDTASAEGDIERLGNILITIGEREKLDLQKQLKALFRESDILRNQIDRVTGTTAERLLFYNKEISLQRDHGGLWFLVKTDDYGFLKPLFRYLQDTGIGGERTSGKGHFEITWDEQPYRLPEAKNPDSFIILSRWFPSENERNFVNGFASWNILNLRPKRDTMYPTGGKRILKDLLRIFSEGSIFPLKEKKEYYGRVEPAGNMRAYTAFHNGLAIPVFARIGGSK